MEKAGDGKSSKFKTFQFFGSGKTGKLFFFSLDIVARGG